MQHLSTRQAHKTGMQNEAGLTFKLLAAIFKAKLSPNPGFCLPLKFLTLYSPNLIKPVNLIKAQFSCMSMS